MHLMEVEHGTLLLSWAETLVALAISTELLRRNSCCLENHDEHHTCVAVCFIKQDPE